MFLFLISGGDARAEFSLGVYPPNIEMVREKDTSLTSQIVVKNYQSYPVSLDIEYRPFSSSKNTDGQIHLLETVSPHYADFFNHVSLLYNDEPISHIELEPLETKHLTLKIENQNRLQKQDYYFCILFIYNNNNTTQNSSNSISPGVGTNIFVTSDSEEQQIVVKEFSTNLFFSHGPVRFRALVSNPGSSLAHPKGYIIIKNLVGQTIARIDLKQSRILSGSERFQTNESNKDINAKTPDFPTTIYWSESFLLGSYTAELFIETADKSQKIGETHFFALPLLPILIISTPIFILVGLWLRITRKL